MADISTIKSLAAQETEYKRHRSQLKNIKKQNEQEYRKIAGSGKAMIDRIQKEQKSQVQTERLGMETKLTDIRKRYAIRIKNENEKFAQELSNLKSSHSQQRAELVESNEKQVASMMESQRNYLDEAKLKFEQEQNKYEA